MRSLVFGAAFLLPLVSTVAGQSQVVITIAVPYCPTYSCTLASFSGILPGYSSSAFSYGSMNAPISRTSSAAIPNESPTNGLSSTSAISTSTSSSTVPAPSASSYVDQYGQVYQLHANTGLSGNTIEPGLSQYKRRQANEDWAGSTLESCLEDCSITSQCQAVSYMGSTCILYSSISGSTFLLGGIAGYNVGRFTGFTNGTGSATSSQTFSSSLAHSTTGSFPANSSMVPSSLYISYYSTTLSSIPGAMDSSTASAISSPSETSRIFSSIDVSTAAASSSGGETESSVPSGAMSTAIVTPIPATSSTSSQQSSASPDASPSSSSALASASTLQLSISSDLRIPTLSSPTSGDLPSPSAASSSMAESSPTTVFGSASEGSATTQDPGPSESASATTSSLLWSSEGVELSIASSTPPSSTSVSSSLQASSTSSEMTPVITTSALISTSSSFVSTPTPEATIYTCPAYNGSTITDVNGVQYDLRCSSDTNGRGLGQGQASDSFNDCFNLCDAAMTCTGFSYLGATNGAGPGDCYLKQGDVYFTDGDAVRVAAVRLTQRASVSASASTSSSVGDVMLSSYLSSIYATPTSSMSSGTMPISSISSSSVALSTSSGVSSSRSSSSSFSTAALSTSSSAASSSRSSSSSASSSRSSAVYPSPYASSSPAAPAAPSATPVQNDGKRGLAYTNASFTLPYSLSGQNSRVSWGYNWYYSRYTDSANTSNPATRFIPLLFNDAADVMAVWPEKAQAAIDDGADALMSFNEPDICYPGSACMTVDQSVRAYRQAMQPFAGKARLGAPAISDGGYGTGLSYLIWFMGNCTGCTVDFINIHWYNNVYAFSYLQYYVQQAYQMFGLPIWITEFGIDGSGGTDAQYQAFLQQALPWLDAVPYVERYAWFLDAPGYLINANGSGLSAQGMIYNSYTAPCPNWNNTDGHC